ncbi:MAG: alpha-amylase, partial [Erysipelotrichaceae bacterium]
HLLDMKVIIDIIPRTNSVNSDLIIDHPDWFYWIDLKDLKSYQPPIVESLKKTLPPKVEHFKKLFSSPEVEEHLHKFRKNPKDLFPLEWEAMVKKFNANPNQEILDLVQATFKMTVAPAFSDHINDPQPAWTDVTFFRLYMDHPVNSQPYLKKLGTFEPYILFDVAKSSYNPGLIPNQDLWEMLSGIIPFYQKEYGIDGARIDMGHALPTDLVSMIISKARAIDPDFCFIAEELDPENAKASIKKGYNMIIGNGFIQEPRVSEGRFNEFAYGASRLASPVFACGETHDTPRLATRKGGETLAKMLTLYNLFIPNTVPFLNSGQEVFEPQPMNTGLDCDEDSAFVLPKDDPFYGKLALFDRYAFHYLHPRRWELITLLEKASKIRADILDEMLTKSKVYPLGFSAPWDSAVGFAYESRNKVTLVLCNTDPYNDKQHYVRCTNLPARFLSDSSVIKQIFSSESEETPISVDAYHNLVLPFRKGEVKIIEIRVK